MKKTILTTLALTLTILTFAQIPSGFSAAYLFNNGSLANCGASSAQDLANFTTSGSVSETKNRKGTDGQAISISSGNSLVTALTNNINYRPLTVSYWIKMDDDTSGSTRLIQFYGNYSGQGTTGFEMNATFTATGTQLSWRAGMYTNGSYRAYTNKTAVDSLDNGNWHHIVFRATPNGSNLDINVFVDNVLAAGLTGSVTTPRGIGDFIRRASFRIAPLSDYEGSFDDVRVYLSSLTDAEVGNLFNEIPPTPKTIYVNHAATGNDDGTSWSNAYADIRDALFNSGDEDQIWVAKGKYIRSGTNRGATFAWTSEAISVYGGFSGDGTETNINQRDWRANETILSGDLGDDGDMSNNAYCVFIGPFAQTAADAVNKAYVDGLIIEDGHANAPGSNRFGRFGAGTLIESNVTTVDFANCTWRNNVGAAGAGIAVFAEFSEKNINFINCTFSANKARIAAPFDLLTFGKNISFKMTNCLINNNEIIDIGTSLGQYGHGGRIISYNGGLIGAGFINTTWANNMDTSSSTTKILLSTHRRFGSGQNITSLENCIMSNNTQMEGNFGYPSVTGNGNPSVIDIRNCLIEMETLVLLI